MGLKKIFPKWFLSKPHQLTPWTIIVHEPFPFPPPIEINFLVVNLDVCFFVVNLDVCLFVSPFHSSISIIHWTKLSYCQLRYLHVVGSLILFVSLCLMCNHPLSLPIELNFFVVSLAQWLNLMGNCPFFPFLIVNMTILKSTPQYWHPVNF